MSEPIVSKRFDVEDIRKIREYNSLRHIQMTPKKLLQIQKKGLKELKRCFRNVNAREHNFKKTFAGLASVF